jgi:hypothetical protein
MFISEKKDRNGGTEKFPHRRNKRNKVRIGVQLRRGDLK